MTSHYVLFWHIYRTLYIIVNSDIFRHIHVLFRHVQSYYGILRTLCNSFIFRTLPYSESWYRTQDIFRTCWRAILAYSERCVTLAESCLFRHIQSYSIMILVITLTFFFHVNLKYFSTKFTKDICFFSYNVFNFNAWLSLLK